jgi:hypothetical protein
MFMVKPEKCGKSAGLNSRLAANIDPKLEDPGAAK